jgi:uncharacterized membrane protein YjgN (DUF898 family)
MSFQPPAPPAPVNVTYVTPPPVAAMPVRPFAFDGGAGTYFGTALLSFIVIVFTLGICTPFAIVLRHRWKAKHTLINGHRLRFNGTGMGLFGNWIKWWVLCIITLGIYGFWVAPRLTKWIVEHQEFDPTQAPTRVAA